MDVEIKKYVSTVYTLTNFAPMKMEWRAKWKFKENCLIVHDSLCCVKRNWIRNMISSIFQLNCKANAANLKRNSVCIQSIRRESVHGGNCPDQKGIAAKDDFMKASHTIYMQKIGTIVNYAFKKVPECAILKPQIWNLPGGGPPGPS